MNREILFRGKQAATGKWVEWSPEGLNKYKVDTDTIGQYTGLTNKNGVKIFEGDYVHVHDVMLQCSNPYHEFNGFISFSDGGFVVIDGGWDTHYRLMDYEMEVIGNIFDNPDILGGNDGTTDR